MIEYGGFWRRAWAYVIDVMVIFPLYMLVVGLGYESNRLAMFAALPLSLIGPAYLVVLHGLCGQSLGKMVAGLKVEESGGNQLSWWNACVRFSPVIASHVAWGIGIASAFHSLPESTLISATYLQRSHVVINHRPSWAHWCTNGYTLWLVAEIIVLQVSKQKRAIHDLLAGTIVRRVKAPMISSGQEAV
jgi:uncharacterized RDD family membrane protein YckC